MSDNTPTNEPKPPTRVPGSAADHVPAHVLDELKDVFSEHRASRYDLDDPSIDRLLGLEPNDSDADATQVMPPTEPIADAAVPAVDDPTGEVVIEPSAAPRKTIVITDSGLPDSVYLDEEKEKGFHERRESERRDAVDGAPERSTILIEDFDEPVVLDAATTKSPGSIDPRMRARRIAVRREEGRRRLVIVGAIAAALVVIIVVIAVFASPIFDVTDVKVQGAVYTDQEVIDQVVSDLTGEPVLLVDTQAAERTLEQVPWVEQAVVSTSFPHSVLIDIRERRPVATFQGSSDGKFRVIDNAGRVLDIIDGQPAALTLITGANPDSRRGEFAGAPYATAGELIAALPAELRSITTSVGVDTATGTLSMVLNGNLSVRLGDISNVADKLARLLAQVRGGLDAICELDVSTAEIGQVKCSA